MAIRMARPMTPPEVETEIAASTFQVPVNISVTPPGHCCKHLVLTQLVGRF
jgi:hypothetical protein